MKQHQFNCNECNFTFVKLNTFDTHMKRQNYLALGRHRMHLHNQHPSQSLPIPFLAQRLVSFCKYFLKKMKKFETHVLHLVTQIEIERRGQTTKGTTEGKGKAKLEGKNEGKLRGQKRGQGQGQNHKLLFTRSWFLPKFPSG